MLNRHPYRHLTEPKAATALLLGEHLEVKKPQIGEPETAGWHDRVLDGQALIRRPPIGKIEPRETGMEQVDLDTTFQCGGGIGGRTAATAAPDVRQGIGEDNGGAILEIDPGKASQDRDRQGVACQHQPDTADEHLAEQISRRHGEALSLIHI